MTCCSCTIQCPGGGGLSRFLTEGAKLLKTHAKGKPVAPSTQVGEGGGKEGNPRPTGATWVRSKASNVNQTRRPGGVWQLLHQEMECWVGPGVWPWTTCEILPSIQHRISLPLQGSTDVWGNWTWKDDVFCQVSAQSWCLLITSNSWLSADLTPVREIKRDLRSGSSSLIPCQINWTYKRSFVFVVFWLLLLLLLLACKGIISQQNWSSALLGSSLLLDTPLKSFPLLFPNHFSSVSPLSFFPQVGKARFSRPWVPSLRGGLQSPCPRREFRVARALQTSRPKNRKLQHRDAVLTLWDATSRRDAPSDVILAGGGVIGFRFVCRQGVRFIWATRITHNLDVKAKHWFFTERSQKAFLVSSCAYSFVVHCFLYFSFTWVVFLQKNTERSCRLWVCAFSQRPFVVPAPMNRDFIGRKRTSCKTTRF